MANTNLGNHNSGLFYSSTLGTLPGSISYPFHHSLLLDLMGFYDYASHLSISVPVVMDPMIWRFTSNKCIGGESLHWRNYRQTKHFLLYISLFNLLFCAERTSEEFSCSFLLYWCFLFFPLYVRLYPCAHLLLLLLTNFCEYF